MNFKSIDDALDFAIKNEEGAFAFYSDLAEKAATPSLRKIMLSFAEEEKGHKIKLEGIKAGKKLLSSQEQVLDLKISDYLVDSKPTPNMSFQDALILAMKAEKAAFKLYSDLAASAEDQALKDSFQALAQEEAKHKLRFELEYDDQILREN